MRVKQCVWCACSCSSQCISSCSAEWYDAKIRDWKDSARGWKFVENNAGHVPLWHQLGQCDSELLNHISLSLVMGIYRELTFDAILTTQGLYKVAYGWLFGMCKLQR